MSRIASVEELTRAAATAAHYDGPDPAATKTYDVLPTDVITYIAIGVMGADNVPRLAFLKPDAIVAQKELTAKIVESVGMDRAGLVASFKARDDAIQAIVDSLVARKAPIPLADLVIPPADLTTLVVVEKTIPKALVGLKTTDVLVLTPKVMPTGYGLRGFSIPSDGNISVKLQCPILSSGGTGITFGAMVFR